MSASIILLYYGEWRDEVVILLMECMVIQKVLSGLGIYLKHREGISNMKIVALKITGYYIKTSKKCSACGTDSGVI
jgi:hypothetical protein